MIGMVLDLIPRECVRKDCQSSPVDKEPWQYNSELVRSERKLAASAWMWPNGAIVHPTDSDLERLSCCFAQVSRPLFRRGVEIHMSMITCNVTHQMNPFSNVRFFSAAS